MQKTMHHVPEKFSENRFSEFRSLPDSGIKADDDLSFCAVWIAGSMLVFRVICRICGMYFAPDEPGVYAAFFLGYLLIGAAYMAQGLFLSVMFRSAVKL